MEFQTPLIRAVLIRRYKRFLADMRLEDGREVTAHCANPGSMLGLAEPGAICWLEPNDDPKKKLKFGWRIVELGGVRVVVDTGAANRVVREALEAGVPGLTGYESIRAEVPYGAKSRVDFLLSGPGRAACFVEVKSVTLSRAPGLAEFPDSVTARGTKHLGELAVVARGGARAVLLLMAMRDDAARFAPAADIDPTWAAALTEARGAGVEVMMLGARISPQGVWAAGLLPID